ncbi:MAG: AbrB/MazE/SpoVT family DNA-binding domain-containing protein [Solirubrobacterales bacterium]|nr:AbrB/MazE/SpoVT family DNA-binding domain-containing protein [Solirubrobacterales bacterium]
MATKVMNKKTRKRDGRVKVTPQGQVSIPAQVMREAGIKKGDRLQASTDRSGRIVLEVLSDAFDKYAGTMPGAFDRHAIESSRDEWDRSS